MSNALKSIIVIYRCETFYSKIALHILAVSWFNDSNES